MHVRMKAYNFLAYKGRVVALCINIYIGNYIHMFYINALPKFKIECYSVNTTDIIMKRKRVI